MGAAPQAQKMLVADEELRGRESRAKLELRLRTRSTPHPPLKEGVVPDLLSLLSAFCAAGQPKMGAAPQAQKCWWPTRS
jgi:hypothetical protein